MPAHAVEGDVLSAVPTDESAERTATTAGPHGLRLMAVHAHPDDESSKGAATMARYAREGVDVLVCTLTGGERGDILNKAMDRPEIRANLPGIRRAEMARAREILGVRQQLPRLHRLRAARRRPAAAAAGRLLRAAVAGGRAGPLVQAVREFRPHVILTYDENGGYPHPDHVKTHEVSVEAFEAAADPDRYPGPGEPWQPLKLYYFVTFHRARFTALHEEMDPPRAGVAVRATGWTLGGRGPRDRRPGWRSPPGCRAGTTSSP